MNPTENQLESQRSGEEPKPIFSVRNLVIGAAVIFLITGAGTFAYFHSVKSYDVQSGEAKVQIGEAKVTTDPASGNANVSTPAHGINTGNAENTENMAESILELHTANENSTNNGTLEVAIGTSESTGSAENTVTLAESILIADTDVLESSTNGLVIDPLELERLNSFDIYGNTALIRAILSHDIDQSLSLIEMGVNLNAKELRGQGYSALFHAIREELAVVVVRLIEKGADMNQFNNDGYVNPLMIALLNEHFAMASLLIEKGANLNLKNVEGQSAIDFAIQKSNIEILRAIIEKGATLEIDLSDRSPEFNTLHWLIYKRRTDIIDLLMENSVFDFDTTDERGFTALHYAETVEMIKFLIRKNPNFESIDLNARFEFKHSQNVLEKVFIFDYVRVRAVLEFIEGKWVATIP